MSDRKEQSMSKWESSLILEKVNETAIFYDKDKGKGVTIIQTLSISDFSMVRFPLESLPKVIKALLAIEDKYLKQV